MKDIKYISTRGENTEITASKAILKGIAEDSGLYVPTSIPKIDFDLEKIPNMSYQDLAYEVLKLYLDDFTETEIKSCIAKAYDEKFDTELIAPLVKTGDSYILELFHGRTLAFKDMALSILPHLLLTSARKNEVNKEIVILTATSGDTGKAALESFANVDGTRIIVFYPKDGVSEVQKMQMLTQEGDNTCVVGVEGNFDDTQTGVKTIFMNPSTNEKLLEKGFILSSANSINIGRLVPQIVYYFYAYAQMVKNKNIAMHEKISFTVPTGNFGNILAGWYAKSMGLPIDKLICASNDNKVLFDFFNTNVYDRNREFILTNSPSMDILISSNLERLLYHLCGSTEKVAEKMKDLSTKGNYTFDIESQDIVSEYALEQEVADAIKEVSETGYILDTHTAVAYVALKKYSEKTNDKTKNIIVSTASPYKFTDAVLGAIDEKYKERNSFDLLNTLAEIKNEEVPEQIRDIDKKPIRHWAVCKRNEMLSFLEMYL